MPFSHLLVCLGRTAAPARGGASGARGAGARARAARPIAVALALAWALPLGAQVPAPAARTLRSAGASDTAFAAISARLSEPAGYFDTDNLISNETSYQHVLGKLDELRLRGGAYVGVGPDQNFTYIARLRPELALIVDIRRDNLLEHLLFRALFQLAHDRLAYLALLLGRPLPPGRRAGEDIERIVAYLDATPMRQAGLDSAVAAVRHAVLGYGVALSQQDLTTIERFHRTFARAGLDLRFETLGRGAAPYDPTLRQLILERDLDGRRRSYLALEEDFQFVRSLEGHGRVIPVVGDLAGARALPAIAAFLRERRTAVTAYYASNVDFYLAREGKLPAFIANLRRLPRASGAVLIRSVFRNQLPQTVPGYASTQLLLRVDDLLAGWDSGSIRSYADLNTRALPSW